jgi:hypothetical protein
VVEPEEMSFSRRDDLSRFAAELDRGMPDAAEPLGQGGDNFPTFHVVHRAPAGDFIQCATAPGTQTRCGIHGAHLDAGRFDHLIPRTQRLGKLKDHRAAGKYDIPNPVYPLGSKPFLRAKSAKAARRSVFVGKRRQSQIFTATHGFQLLP